MCAYRDVNSFGVPILVHEEIYNVYSVKHGDGYHGPGNQAMDLVLIRRPAQVDDCPGNDTGAAVVEELQVPVLDSRIELNLDVPG